MNLAYKKILGKFTKVLGFGKTPPPCWEKFPNDIVFFLERTLDVLGIFAAIIQALTSIFCSFYIPPPHYDIKPAQSWLPCSECDWRVETDQHGPSSHPDRPCCKFLCLSFSLHFHYNLYITLTALAVSWCVFVIFCI